MKILHTADLHLGKMLGGYLLLEDQKKVLDQMADIADEKGADVVAISGDVYQSSVATGDAMMLFTNFLTRLSQSGHKVMVISGNHDSEQRIAYMRDLLKQTDVHVSGPFDGRLQSLTLEDAYGPVSFYLLPFIRPAQVRLFYPEEKIESFEEALSCVIRHSAIRPEERNVLLCHQFVTGAEKDDSEEMMVGTAENISRTAFEDFDLVLMGHIHRPQCFLSQKTLLTYAGSPLVYSMREQTNAKSVSLLTLSEKGEKPVLERLPLTPLHEVRTIRGTYQELLRLPPSEDYVSVILTDTILPVEARGVLIQQFPHLLSLQHWPDGIKAAVADEEGDEEDDQGLLKGFSAEEGLGQMSEADIFAAFYQKVKGSSMTKEQQKLVRELLDEMDRGGEEEE